METLMDLHVLRSLESEIHIFSGLSLFVCVCVISITQKIYLYICIAETSNLVFYIFIIHRYYLKLFMKVGQMCRELQKIQKHYSLWIEFLFSTFQCVQTTLNAFKVTYVFAMFKDIQPTEYGMKSVYNLSARPCKNNSVV